MNYALFNPDWVREVAWHYSVSEDLLLRLREEFLATTDITVNAYVSARHLELQKQGLANAEIFAVLQSEVASGRFRQSGVSLRQIRRWIYG